MLTLLAFRHLLVRKVRSFFLLLGFSLGVGVMIVLLSIGEAMLDQSRDVSLVGGGELTVLPEGIDIESMRTGGAGGMFFGIDRARFLTRMALGGPRYSSQVQVVSPVIEGKLLYLSHGERTVAVRAGGEIPSRARAVGSALAVRSGRWEDTMADSAYVLPTAQQLYDELDRFHLPAQTDSTWGEWHYFNLVLSPNEWWYITFLVGGEVPSGEWGGRLLMTRRRPDGVYQQFTAEVPATRVAFDTAASDLTIGRHSVRQRNGVYRLHAEGSGSGGVVRLDVDLVPAPGRYFPPVELSGDAFLSGYVVPALSATAAGRICLGAVCRSFTDVPAYHDHNWGVWRGVTWEWGTGQGSHFNLLYGGVYGSPEEREGTLSSPFFLALVDSLGVKQVLRFNTIRYHGSQPAAGPARMQAPRHLSLAGTRDADSVRLEVRVVDALSSEIAGGDFRRVFLQMRGRFTLSGRLGGQTLADSGMGFFETYVTPGRTAR